MVTRLITSFITNVHEQDACQRGNGHVEACVGYILCLASLRICIILLTVLNVFSPVMLTNCISKAIFKAKYLGGEMQKCTRMCPTSFHFTYTCFEISSTVDACLLRSLLLVHSSFRGVTFEEIEHR